MINQLLANCSNFTHYVHIFSTTVVVYEHDTKSFKSKTILKATNLDFYNFMIKLGIRIWLLVGIVKQRLENNKWFFHNSHISRTVTGIDLSSNFLLLLQAISFDYNIDAKSLVLIPSFSQYPQNTCTRLGCNQAPSYWANSRKWLSSAGTKIYKHHKQVFIYVFIVWHKSHNSIV